MLLLNGTGKLLSLTTASFQNAQQHTTAEQVPEHGQVFKPTNASWAVSNPQPESPGGHESDEELKDIVSLWGRGGWAQIPKATQLLYITL